MEHSEVYPLSQVENRREETDVVELLGGGAALRAAAENALASASAGADAGSLEEEEVTFACTLDTGSGKLGMKVDFWVCCAQVVEITEGGIAEKYNKEAPEERRLRRNDFLTRINGESAVEILKERMTFDGMLTMTVVRPRKMHLLLQRGGAAVAAQGGEGDMTRERTEDSAGNSWGIKLRNQAGISSCLHVDGVVPGAVQAHNARAAPESQIRRHDFIERVNGVSGHSRKMYKEFKNAQSVELVVLRASELSGAAA